MVYNFIEMVIITDVGRTCCYILIALTMKPSVIATILTFCFTWNALQRYSTFFHMVWCPWRASSDWEGPVRFWSLWLPCIIIVSVMELGHLLMHSGLTYPEVSSKVCHDSFCQLGNSVSLPWVIYYGAFYLHVVSRLKVAILPLDLPCSGPVTHSGEILTTGKSHGLPCRNCWNCALKVRSFWGSYWINKITGYCCWSKLL